MFICHRCDKRFEADSADKFCPYCGTFLSKPFIRQFFETEAAYDKSCLLKKQLELELADKLKSSELAEIDKLNSELEDMRSRCEKYYSENDLDPFEMEKLAASYALKRKMISKYEKLLGSEYLREKKYYKPKSKDTEKGYLEYIHLPDKEKEKYDGLCDFEYMTLVSYDENSIYFERASEDNDSKLITKYKEGYIEAFPGEAICRDNFDTAYGDIFFTFFERGYKFVPASELKKNRIHVMPARLKKEDVNYKIMNKGKIMYLIEEQVSKKSKKK